MCAQFIIKARIEEFTKWYGITVHDDFNLHVLPYGVAPVIINNGSQLLLQQMQFSLIPSWAKERKVKYATHNARIDSLIEKPTWKKPFISTRCLVPLTQFIEPIYAGEYKGFLVQFFEKSGQLLTAAGIYDRWLDPQTNQVLQSFAIITGEPYAYIKDIGHDRSPVLLRPDGFSAWLDSRENKPSSLLEILKSYCLAPDWNVERYRPMKEGWEKRIR